MPVFVCPLPAFALPRDALFCTHPTPPRLCTSAPSSRGYPHPAYPVVLWLAHPLVLCGPPTHTCLVISLPTPTWGLLPRSMLLGGAGQHLPRGVLVGRRPPPHWACGPHTTPGPSGGPGVGFHTCLGKAVLTLNGRSQVPRNGPYTFLWWYLGGARPAQYCPGSLGSCMLGFTFFVGGYHLPPGSGLPLLQFFV